LACAVFISPQRWAQFEFARIKTTPTILPNEIEDLREAVGTWLNSTALIASKP